MKSLLWITDAHLDHLSDTAEDAWFEKLGKSRADMLLLGGDTANARIFLRMLGRVEEVFSGKVALVAGNHDYYHTSISEFREKLAGLQRSGVVVFEPGCQSEPLPVAETVYLCGSGGWGDACAGLADASGMALNDENLIAELRAGDLTAKLRSLGKESAKHLQKQLALVPGDASCVIVLTHVPPWPEASWHEGRNSDAMALPRFCWQAGGEVISEVAVRMPQTQFVVLCGHTHSDGIWEKGNIVCHTVGSAYGRISHAGIITLGQIASVRRLGFR
ncbi:MAG: metallophosphoesterase [Verrucomicrobiae bacterium]